MWRKILRFLTGNDCLVSGHIYITETWVDRSSGPGWMADVYEAQVCSKCGNIQNVKKVY